MITALRRFYRRTFCSVARATFLELFERCTNLSRAIMLEETSPLAGIVVTYFWQEFPESCRLVIREVNLKKKIERTITQRNLPKPEFADVLEQIEKAGGADLGNFSGKVIDGVFYSLYWGAPSGLVSLSIKNPQSGSERHQRLIMALKKRATETSQ